MEWDRMDDYLSEFQRLKQAYAGYVELYIALEIDYLNEDSHPASACFQALPLDYRIGSVHLLYDGKGEVVDGDLPAPKFAKMVLNHFHGDIETVVHQYFERANRMLQLGGFDILGHADKVHYNAEWFRPHITEEDWYIHLVRTHLTEAVRGGYLPEGTGRARGCKQRCPLSRPHQCGQAASLAGVASCRILHGVRVAWRGMGGGADSVREGYCGEGVTSFCHVGDTKERPVPDHTLVPPGPPNGLPETNQWSG